MSLAKMHIGGGVDYMLKNIARGDGNQIDAAQVSVDGSLAAYYTASGYPPGVWIGTGLSGLNNGRGLPANTPVDEVTMGRLFGAEQDPVTGRQLGRTPIGKGTVSKSVVGFDLTFSVPKSVSVLWGLADVPLRAVIEKAHHEAVGAVLASAERDVIRTRLGAGGTIQVPTRGTIAARFDHFDSRDGDPQLHTHVTVANRVQAPDGRWLTVYGQRLFRAAVAMSETYDAILADAITRSLGLDWERRDRGIGRNPARELAAVPPELIAEFSKRAARIGAAKDRAIDKFVSAHGRQPTDVEVIKIRQQATLSTRRAKRTMPLEDYTRLWRARAASILKVNADGWATRTVRRNATRPRLHSAEMVRDRDVEILAASVLNAVEAKRSTWTRWNIQAETARQIAANNTHFTSASDLLAVRDRIAQSAVDRSVLLNPVRNSLARDHIGLDLMLAGAEPAVHQVFTSLTILAAEDRLLAAAEDRGSPVATPQQVSTLAAAQDTTKTRALSSKSGRDAGASQPGLFEIAEPALSERVEVATLVDVSQDAAVVSLVTSGRVCDVLVGPAGAGKSTTMRQLRATWEATFGPYSVIGLAPSAAAARVLGAEGHMAAETTAQWVAQQGGETRRLNRLIDLQRRRERRKGAGIDTQDVDEAITAARVEFDRWRLRPGQLVIVDEAGMADTKTLDAIATQARNSGAKVVLVGDPAQLSAVGAGGAFAMLTRARSDTPELARVRRFRNPDGSDNTAEAAASILLRTGNARALDYYQARGRIHSVADGGDVLETAYVAGKTDRQRGLRSLLIAGDNATVTELNRQAREDLIRSGTVQPVGVRLADGTQASIGDRIVTRMVDRHLADGATRARQTASGALTAGFVTNGASFTVTGQAADGGLIVRADRGTPVPLPAEYVAAHVQLGYAVTAHRAQGATVDTAHVIAAPGMTREAFYVAMTRGRYANHAHVITDNANTSDVDRPDNATAPGARDVLAQILAYSGQAISAHDTRAELERQAQQWVSLRQVDAAAIPTAAPAPEWLPPADRARAIGTRAAGQIPADLRRALQPRTAVTVRNPPSPADPTPLGPQQPPRRGSRLARSSLHTLFSERRPERRPDPPSHTR